MVRLIVRLNSECYSAVDASQCQAVVFCPVSVCHPLTILIVCVSVPVQLPCCCATVMCVIGCRTHLLMSMLMRKPMMCYADCAQARNMSKARPCCNVNIQPTCATMPMRCRPPFCVLGLAIFDTLPYAVTTYALPLCPFDVR